jgi:hypothetical protein
MSEKLYPEQRFAQSGVNFSGKFAWRTSAVLSLRKREPISVQISNPGGAGKATLKDA